MTQGASYPSLLLAPRGRDAQLMQVMLERHELNAQVCTSAEVFLEAVTADAGCAIITQEALDTRFRDQLARVLAAQPPWSDFPVIVLANASSVEVVTALAEQLGNVTVLERPVAPHTLLAAVRASLRGRVRQQEARMAIQQRDQFLAMLGHELRNPLAAIVLAAKLAHEGTDRAQLDRRMEIIERQSNMLARLVDDLLDVARVTTGKVRLRREAVDIDATIQSCITALEERARDHAMTVVFAASSNAVIEGDTVRLEQVFSNLLSNAIKYSPAGRTVRVWSVVDGTTCEVHVRDQGIGIAAEMQPRVFDLFTQVDGSIERAEGGMGIGLTLVDRLVRLHGGTVQLQSAGLGLGSEFIVRLPIGEPPVPDNVVPLSAARDARKLRVLLVEDNADLRELTREMLEMLDCMVDVAVDGIEGVERIVASRPDLALVDIGLPGLDGFSLGREVRRLLGTDQFLVAVTGYGRDQDREEARRVGFDLHVTKPLTVETLRSLIERARARMQLRTGTP